MTPLNLIRLTQALVLATIAAALAAPTLALAGANSRYGPRDGWYTYAASVTKSDRKAASDSNRYGPRDGWYTYAVSLASSAKTLAVDGRSPDTRDAAFAASNPGNAGPGFVEQNDRAHFGPGNSDAPTLAVSDGRSPDTLDAASGPQLIEVARSGSFDWGDAGIGGAVGAAFIGLLGSSLLRVRVHRRQRVQTM